MKRFLAVVSALTVAVLLVGGCAQSAPTPAPTKAAEPAKAAQPAKPAEATKPAEAAKPAAPTAAPTAVPAKKVDFPAKGKAVTIIVPFAAGGGTDLLARLVAGAMEKDLGSPVQVVNKPGAASVTGNVEALKEKPDGYTLVAVVPSTMHSYLDPQRPTTYSGKDFQPVAVYATEPQGIMVRADSKYQGVKEIVDAVKADPAQFKAATSGLMGASHFFWLLTEGVTGVKYTYVHFDGVAPAMTAVLGKHVDALGATPSTAVAQVKSGDVKVVAVSSDKRTKFFPDSRTMTEQGYALISYVFYGLAAPAGTPMDVVNILSESIKKAMNNPDFQKKLDDLAMTPQYMDAQQFTTYWKEEETRTRGLIDQVRKQK